MSAQLKHRPDDNRSPDRPLVTVLLPCYNAHDFLPPALDSVLGQTYKNLEILAIDDGSNDPTAEILAEYAARDSRIRLSPNQRNLGVIHTLNRGVELAAGTLIARMDADDIALSHRIEAQVAYFWKYPETELLCTDYSYIGMKGQLLPNPYSYHFSERVLRFFTFFLNPLCHPTVMGRRATFLKHRYSEHAPHSEDFELWNRMVLEGVVIRHLPERLLRFRCTVGSVSQRNEEQQTATFLRTTKNAIEQYFRVRISPEIHRVLVNRMSHGTVHGTDVKAALSLFRQMKHEYCRREGLDRSDKTLISDFSDCHVLNMLVHSYKRSSSTDSARGYALRQLIPLAARYPALVSLLARIRENIRR